MRALKHAVLAGVILLLAACSTAPAARHDSAAAEKEVMQRVDTLLNRYSNNDQAGVVAMLDPARITIFGSDLSEAIRSADGLRTLMSRHFSQWGAAKFTDVRDSDVRVEGDLATAYFVITFSSSQGPTLPIRLCTTWHKVHGEWLLTQSANAVMAQR